MSRKAYFSAVAATWDQHYYTQELADWLEQVVPTWGLQQGDRVLDVGTGTGLLIPFIRHVIGLSGSITAIDYADHMIQICRSKYAHLDNVMIQCQDVENLELPAASFDAVICFGVFPHIDQKDTTLENLYRVLKSGGRLIIAHALSSTEIKVHHQNTESTVASDVLPEASEMRHLLRSTGFVEISIQDEYGYYLCLSTKLR